MSTNRIAIIKLARGEVGFFDDLTRIHLTLSRPSADVYDYMNTAKLRRAVSGKVIDLVAGSLMPTSKKEIEIEKEVAKEVKKECNMLHVEHNKTEVKTEVKAEVEAKPKKTKVAAKKKDKDEE